jgi:hypothetical protein
MQQIATDISRSVDQIQCRKISLKESSIESKVNSTTTCNKSLERDLSDLSTRINEPIIYYKTFKTLILVNLRERIKRPR